MFHSGEENNIILKTYWGRGCGTRDRAWAGELARLHSLLQQGTLCETSLPHL